MGLEWAADQGLPISRRMLGIDDLLGADEVLLTNSSWGILPVVGVEKERIGEGAVGEVARAAREAWLEAAEEYAGEHLCGRTVRGPDPAA